MFFKRKTKASSMKDCFLVAFTFIFLFFYLVNLRTSSDYVLRVDSVTLQPTSQPPLAPTQTPTVPCTNLSAPQSYKDAYCQTPRFKKLKASPYRFAFVTLVEPSDKILLGVFKNMLDSLELYDFEADVVVLHEHIPEEIQQVMQRSQQRRLKFVNVEKWFKYHQEDERKMKTCIPWGSLGYRYMCRFMSGPVYWLSELDEYDYIIRMDDDSKFTSTVKTDLVHELSRHGSPYGYAIDGGDTEECHQGAEAFMKNFAKNTSSLPNIEVTSTNFRYRNSQLDWVASDVMNCNFEVVELAYFRNPHYREYWQKVNGSDLFLTTRLGDHQVKTMYLTLFLEPWKLLCFGDLAYEHPHMRRCHHKGHRTHSIFVKA